MAMASASDPSAKGDDGDGDDRPPRWVPVASYSHPAEAHIARQKMESEGIESYLDNENLVATDFLLSNATGGIKLMVREPDVPAAEAVLQSVGTEELAGEVGGADDYCDEDWRCSKCRRTNVELVPLPKLLVLLTLPLLCAPLLLLSRTCRCRSCGYEWRQ